MKKGQPKGLVCGIGINDVPCARKTVPYNKWKSMLERCYIPSVQSKHPTYIGCSVCDEWLTFSNFLDWFNEHYVEGYVIDKDILIKGNKVYSPQTCCFVPPEINGLIVKARKAKCFTRQQWGKCIRYYSSLNTHKGRLSLGCFTTPEEAFYAYKSAKENYVKELALSYFERGLITEKVKDALLKYEVDITD